MKEQAFKAYFHLKMLCTEDDSPSPPPGLVVDIFLSSLDVHVNYREGRSFPSIGLAAAVGLLALMKGKAVDPKACFLGVSGVVAVVVPMVEEVARH